MTPAEANASHAFFVELVGHQGSDGMILSVGLENSVFLVDGVH